MRTTGNDPAHTPGRRRLTAAQRRAVIERAATEVFTEHGYRNAGMHEIAQRAGVSVPVLYDHFSSKQQLYRELLERHFAELRALWAERLRRELPSEQRLAAALDSWFSYVRSHPFAWRMLFVDTTGDPVLRAAHQRIAEASRTALLPVLARELPTPVPGVDDEQGLAMTWEIIRASLQGLALWWREHEHVPREQVVAMAMNILWIGFQRLHRGEHWHAE